MWPIRAREIVINIVFLAFSNSVFDRSILIEETPKKVLQSDRCFICSTSVQKRKKRKKKFWNRSFDFRPIVSSCLDVNVSCYSPTSELSVCKACYRRLIKFKKASDRLEKLKYELKGIFKYRELPRTKRLFERLERRRRNPGPVPWKILDMFTIRSNQYHLYF